jgi:Calcineurin-like phosphoesterase
VSKASKLRSIVIVFLFASGIAAPQGAVKGKPKPDSGAASAAERAAQPAVPAAWSFAVSGDSRNCGDVIMPAIAASVKKNNAAFYWHLGDLRATAFMDEDYLHEPEHRTPPPDKGLYDKAEWDDFIQSQLNFFGATPVFVGIGNHETYPPKSREQFIIQFADWLDSPTLRQQRLADNPNDHALKSFFHWIQNGVDFIYLDNSTKDQFDSYQLGWFEGVLKRAAADENVKTVVVGMHAALPDSLAAGHSMSDTDAGTHSGRQVYTDLLNFRQQTHKQVYVLSSHSHFYMSGIFDSDYWRANGGVLPGWIVGTAGAMRYALPATAARAKEARQKIYGYLLGTARPDGSIDFVFHEIKREDIPGAVNQRYTPEFVDFCFSQNTDLRTWPAPQSK